MKWKVNASAAKGRALAKTHVNFVSTQRRSHPNNIKLHQERENQPSQRVSENASEGSRSKNFSWTRERVSLSSRRAFRYERARERKALGSEEPHSQSQFYRQKAHFGFLQSLDYNSCRFFITLTFSFKQKPKFITKVSH